MSLPRKVTIWLLVLAVMHGIVLCAGFFAPYNPVQQDLKNSSPRICIFSAPITIESTCSAPTLMAAINYPGYSSVAKYHYSQACLARASPFLSDGVSAPRPDTTVVGETTCSCALQNFSSPCPGCISFLPSGLSCLLP